MPDPGPNVVAPSHWLVTITLKRKVDDLVSERVPVNVTSIVYFLDEAIHEKLRGEVNEISWVVRPTGALITYVGLYVNVDPVQTKVLKSVATALDVPL